MSMGEAHRRLSEYVNEFTEAIASQNGSALQPLLAISSNSPYRESVASAIQVLKVLNISLSLPTNNNSLNQFQDYCFNSCILIHVGGMLKV